MYNNKLITIKNLHKFQTISVDKQVLLYLSVQGEECVATQATHQTAAEYKLKHTQLLANRRTRNGQPRISLSRFLKKSLKLW